MSFLIRWVFTLDDGTVKHDETVIADMDSIEGFSKGLTIDGEHGTVRIEFDPPLTVMR